MIRKERLLIDLDSNEKLEIIIKLMPYVLPKVRDISHDNNEPFVLGITF